MENDFIGKIFTGTGSGPIRVLCADEITILHEPMKTFGWYFENIKTANFFVYPTDYFRDNFVVLFDNSVKQPEDVNRFFPNIPIRLIRYPNLFWAESPFETLDASRKFCFNNNIQTDDEIVLNVPEIYINPSSALGRINKGPLIKSVKKIGFTVEELIFHAFSVQSKYIKPKQTSIQYGRYGPIHSGIGLYRQGIRSNKPEYYIAGYHDKAGNTLRAESLQ